ncbi:MULTISPECIES: GspH/FimT family pseudopilin [unclassified Novosphingobium]|uniref:GspH/FimT family pseudopilin n=1 Tax=unclassified Novosphingobium TaxID=2644732 RepID=UPI00146D6AAF|nr:MULTISPECIES: GspH/FimT family pseudopilin [unclassified Novosphingobium]NMN06102.1 general secretion pathway protein H [Novosphingobium sp. SG919]NMN88399.1 general secretion pathway protein H [Novosphingobium sp. SG916]
MNPASAHSPASFAPEPENRGGQAGFSLVELIVALAIAGLAATAVILAMPGFSSLPETEAQRLALRLAAARDAAVIGGRPVALTIDRTGYAFAVRHDDAWTALADRRLAAHAWPPGLAVDVPGAGGVTRRVLFDAVGMPSAPLAVELAADGQRAGVAMAPDGAVTVVAR